MDKIKVYIDGHGERQIDKGSTILDIAKDIFKENYRDYPIAIKNNIVQPLMRKVCDLDEINFQHITSVWGYRAYTKTIAMIFSMAFAKLFPKQGCDLNHYLGAGLYIDFDNGFHLDEKDLKNLADEMKNIIAKDIPIEMEKLSRKEALDHFETHNRKDLVRLINTLDRDEIRVNSIAGYKELYYLPLAPSTSYTPEFRLMQYYPGILLIAPSHRNNYDISHYNETPKLSKVFSQATDWAKIMDLNHLASLNEKVMANEYIETIRISESLQDRRLVDIADTISKDDDLRLILISGPTSSGKTTFSEKLMISLKVLGLTPVRISMDDYFVDRDDTPKDENGEYDFESPYAVNIEAFNNDMNKLLNGEEIFVRRFDFLEGKNIITDQTFKIDKHSPIIIEGIHALNPLLTNMVPEKNKFKIYISALTQLNIDSHSRISTTDTRFIRRAVRDYKYRGYSLEDTFKMWQNIRDSERKYIYPFQENADVMFDSALAYEVCVLKKHILPMLEEISEDSPYYSESIKLRKFVELFKDIEDEDAVPKNSILREFIGGGYEEQ
ncbi:MAG: nucleoside kinase [Tissierellia bacterium]|nr:nucleoside kinase [Tissierellia bacterium]